MQWKGAYTWRPHVFTSASNNFQQHLTNYFTNVFVLGCLRETSNFTRSSFIVSPEEGYVAVAVLSLTEFPLNDSCLNRQTSYFYYPGIQMARFNPWKPELNLICYLLALLGAHHFLHVSRIRVKLLTFRLLLSYIYGATILDVSRSHTTTQHSR